MKTYFKHRIITAVFLFLLVPSISFSDDIPAGLRDTCGLSPDFTIQDSSGKPDNHIAFLGILTGQWDKKLDSYVIVESIASNGKFEGYYYWGVYENWGIKEAGCMQVSGKIKKNKMKFRSSSASQSYTLKDNSITARFVRNGRTTKGKFTKLD